MQPNDLQPAIGAVRQVLAGAVDVDAGPDMGPDRAPQDWPDAPPDGPGFAPGYSDGPDGPPDMPPPPPMDPIEASAALPENDHGNGQRFALHFGGRALWVPRVGWHIWDGMRWLSDPDGNGARALAHQLGGLIERETRYLAPADRTRALMEKKAAAAAKIKALSAIKNRSADQDEELAQAMVDQAEAKEALDTDKGRVGKRIGFAKTSGNSARMDNALKEGSIKLLKPLERMDASTTDVNTRSGVLRVEWVDDWTGISDKKVPQIRLISHASNSENTRDLLMTKMMDVVYDPTATCPKFDAFLERIQPHADMRAFLLRWFGLCMTAITGEQKLCFFYGNGKNGKSVLVDLVARIMGDYSATAKIESLTGTNRRGGGDATPDLVPLIGARFVRASEPDQGVQWQEGLLKELTGGEKIMVRALHSDFVEAQPKFKLTISGNHKPDIRGTDDGIWRRLLLVPFAVKIPDSETIEKDKLDAMLFAESSGILNRMIQGLLDYLQNGLGEPASVLEATAEFREESDPFGQFLTSACVISGEHGDTMTSRNLTMAFNFWRMCNGQSVYKDTTVAHAMKQRSRIWAHPETGLKFTAAKAGITIYRGLRLNDFFKRQFDNAPRDAKGNIMRPDDSAYDLPDDAPPTSDMPDF